MREISSTWFTAQMHATKWSCLLDVTFCVVVCSERLLCSDVFGGMGVGVEGASMFIDDSGRSRSISELIVTERAGRGYDKLVTKVKTPKVLIHAAVRTDSLVLLPLQWRAFTRLVQREYAASGWCAYNNRCCSLFESSSSARR